ncbi:MAG: T9SS type A sorting domain-containing protein [bacterium]|nr:T9SS type A sorting domain-containing protein [bacterium]
MHKKLGIWIWRVSDTPPCKRYHCDGGRWLRGYLTLFIGILIATNAFAGAPDTLWTRTFGGTNYDEAYSVQQTKDSGFIIAGMTSTAGTEAIAPDVYLIKINSSGNTLWTKHFGGTLDDYGYSVQQTSDNGFIIVGYTRSSGAGSEDVYIIKTNSSGDTLWTRTFGGATVDNGKSVQQTSDGGFIITGYTNSFGAGGYDVYLIKMNSSGNTLWTKTYGGVQSDVGYSVSETPDGGFIIAGTTYSFGAGNYDVYLIRTNSSGDTLWTKTFGRADDDYGYSVRFISGKTEGFIIVGTTHSFGAGSYDVYLIRTNSSGDTLWTRTFGGTNGDGGNSIFETQDSGFIITGHTSSFGAGGYDNIYLIRTNSSGDTLWTKTVGGTKDDYGYSVQQTQDGGFIIAGWTTSFGAGMEDVYLIRLGKETGVEEEQLPVVSPSTTLRVNKNPFVGNTVISYSVIGYSGNKSTNNDYTSIRLTIHDLSGRCVKTLVDGEKKAGSYNVILNAKGLSTGVYFISLSAGGHKETKKFVVMK